MGVLAWQDERSNFMLWVMLSLGLHVGVVLITWLAVIIMQFLGWNIPLFQNLAVKPRDVEFVLVDNTPEAPPRQPTTRRAEHSTRSGGKRVPNQPQQITQRAAGAPSQRSQPRPAVQPTPKPAPQPTPQKVAQRPAAKPAPLPQPQPKQATTPQPTPRPSPPAPKMPQPTKVADNSPALPPNPVAPIRMPAPPNPSVSGGGPVVKTPGSGSSGGTTSGGSGNPGPSMIAGNPTRGGSGSPGSSARTGGGGGAGGRGSYSQSGSPGGGGGADGVDAMAEPDFGPYIAELQRRIRRNWAPPVEDRSKRVVAMFKISRDGRLLSLRIQQSSGSPQADAAAMAAVRASAPFRQLPPNFRGSDIDVQFIFDYEIYGHGSAKMR